MKSPITRREFLRHGALATAALTVSPLNLLAEPAKIDRKGKPKRVVILGAGLAGLSAGYELTQAGHDVVILEARARAGGRVHTLHQPFAEGLYAEAGATRIPENHELTFKYINAFGLKVDEFRPIHLHDVTYIHGQRIVAARGEQTDWPVELSPEERGLGLTGLRQKYVTPFLDELGEVSSPDWTPPESLKEYDAMTWAEFLRKQGASPAAIDLLTIGHTSGLRDEVSALQALRVSAQGRARRQMYKIRGGNDLLPQSFAQRLEGKIRYNAPVVKIEHDDKGVRVAAMDSGKQQTVEGDYIVCAIPFSILRKIEVAPRFSVAKQRAIDEMWYVSIARIYLQTKSRYWLEEELSGFARTDLPIMEVWAMSHNLPGARGILLAYFSGEPARKAAGMNEQTRLTSALEHMEKLFPGTGKQYETGTSVLWDEEEWTRGAWAWLKPNQSYSILPQIARPEGRIHFAGDHTSAWSSWMQGALQSGNRAAQEINDRP